MFARPMRFILLFSLCLIVINLFSVDEFIQPNKVTIIGTGYVGLVTGVCLAQKGHHVVCHDIDATKIEALNNGQSPIYEPGLAEMIQYNISANRLRFTTDLKNAIQDAEIIFIAVNTPTSEQGCADLTALESAVKSIAQIIDHDVIICIKSTVPPGTNITVQNIVNKNLQANIKVDFVSNPEFLREGSAITDTLYPDRIIIGARNAEATNFLRKLYNCLGNVTYYEMTPEEAEIVKYSSNACLAMKITFANEIAQLCATVGANINKVLDAVGADKRIGKENFKPGPGFGGSCFPKDLQALIYENSQRGLPCKLIKSIPDSNELHQKMIARAIISRLHNYPEQKTICALGLSFKANTDDIRYSPALSILSHLQHSLDCKIQTYDPKASEIAKRSGKKFKFCDSVKEAATNADVILILTEWQEFKELNWVELGQIMNRKLIIDLRDVIDSKQAVENGFQVFKFDIIKELEVEHFGKN